MTDQRRRDPLAWGLILIVLGAIFLFHNMDIGIWDFSARLWPLILIFWGGWKLYFGLKDRNKSIGNIREKK